jgi:hypothetical protein
MNLPAVLHIGSRCGQGFMELVRVDFKLVVQIPGSANHVKVSRERGSWSATLLGLIGDTECYMELWTRSEIDPRNAQGRHVGRPRHHWRGNLRMGFGRWVSIIAPRPV